MDFKELGEKEWMFRLWVGTEFVSLKSGYSEREVDNGPLFTFDELRERYNKENNPQGSSVGRTSL